MFNYPNHLKARTRDWYRVSAMETKEGEVIGRVEILDAIDEIWGVNPSELISQIRAMKADTIRVSINSPGGSVFGGLGIFNSLKNHPAKVITENIGLAASIASVILMAGDEVFQHEQSMTMIHRAWGLSAGNAKELRDVANVLDKIDGQLVSIYSSKTGLDPVLVENYLDKETWFTAAEAQEINLAKTLEYPAAKIAAAFDLSIYKNTPDLLKKITNQDLLDKVRAEETMKAEAQKKDYLKRRLELLELN
jgi:ATP-dependent Clp protease, protease subunit